MEIKTTKKLFRKEQFKIVDYRVKDLYNSVSNLDTLNRKYKNITLQLDGGGILGIIPALQLYVMESRVNSKKRKKKNFKKINDFFKTIWGTSTGAIISGLIAIGVPAKEILELYVEQGSNIFDTQKGGAINIFSKATYSRKYIDKLLDTYFGDIKFVNIMENGIDLNIATVDPIQRETIICNNTNTPNMLVKDAIRASMSAPMFFGPYSYFGEATKDYPQNNIFFDGATGNYNCTLEKAICKNLYKDKIKPEDFYVHSLGCGKLEYKSESRDADIKNIKKFRKIKQILWTLSFAREESANRQITWAEYRAKDLGINFKRVDFNLPKKLSKIDKTNNINEVLELVQKEMKESK